MVLVEMARCMLHGGSIDLRLWSEAVAYACYIINCSSTRALRGMAP